MDQQIKLYHDIVQDHENQLNKLAGEDLSLSEQEAFTKHTGKKVEDASRSYVIQALILVIKE